MSKIVICGCLEDSNPIQLGLIREIHEVLTAIEDASRTANTSMLSPRESPS